jgi:hypothetical protein
MKKIEMMLMIGGLFVAVGYLLVGSALFFELTQFHPLLDDVFATQTNHSLAGGGPERTSAALNAQLATIHQCPRRSSGSSSAASPTSSRVPSSYSRPSSARCR